MKSNEMAECTFTPQQPLVVDTCGGLYLVGVIWSCSSLWRALLPSRVFVPSWFAKRMLSQCVLVGVVWHCASRRGAGCLWVVFVDAVGRFKNCEGLSRIAFLDGNGVVMLGKIVRRASTVEGSGGGVALRMWAACRVWIVIPFGGGVALERRA